MPLRSLAAVAARGRDGRAPSAEVWRVDVAADREPDEAALAVLTAGERERLDRFRERGDRARYGSVRAALRLLLGERLGVPPRTVPIMIGIGGKPRLADAELRFNVAHSGGHGLIAISVAEEVGVDIERDRPASEIAGLAGIALSPPERSIFDAAAAGRRPGLFMRAWTAKEAALKATGAGLTLDPRRMTVLGTDGALADAVDDGFGPGAPQARLFEVPAPEGYAAALATIGLDAAWL